MITLLHGGEVYAPQPLGKKDILIVGQRIGAVSEPGQITLTGLPVEEIDASDRIVTPGFVDGHVHILGGGGEGGPTTRAPEISIEEIISSGVTTLIGCLGTDGITRHMESLLAKARGLEEEGISTYIFSGSYEIPVNTLTGGIRSDLVIVDKVIGAGEIAISDHRSSQPSFEDFARLAAECRVGGMLGGKPGVLHCHLGDGPRRLELIFRLIKETEIPPTQVMPTHCNRNPELLEECIQFVRLGGYIDLTADLDPEPKEEGHLSVATCIRRLREKQAFLDQVTVSSDSNGSMPVFDRHGNLTGLTIATQKSLLTNFRYLVKKKITSLPETIRLFSTNPAAFYKLGQKGVIQAEKDADLLVFDKNLELTEVLSKGKIMMSEARLLAESTFAK